MIFIFAFMKNYVLALSYFIIAFYIEVFIIFINPYDYMLLFSTITTNLPKLKNL